MKGYHFLKFNVIFYTARNKGLHMNDFYELRWTKAFSVSDDLLDEHHKMLFTIINKFTEASQFSCCEHVLLQNLFDDLKNYIAMHFSIEEDLMASKEFAELDEHKKLHQAIVVKISNFEKQIAEGSTLELVELADFLRRWIVVHILVEDKKYVSLDGFISREMKKDVSWDDSLLVGIPVIDEQHKEIIRLYEKMVKHDDTEMDDLILSILGYIKIHFTEEEVFIKQSKYPKGAHHIQIHNDFIESFSDLLLKYKHNLLGRRELTLFMKHWLVEHLLVEDMALFKWAHDHENERGL